MVAIVLMQDAWVIAKGGYSILCEGKLEIGKIGERSKSSVTTIYTLWSREQEVESISFILLQTL